MTYNVFGGTFSLTQSINQSINQSPLPVNLLILPPSSVITTISTFSPLFRVQIQLTVYVHVPVGFEHFFLPTRFLSALLGIVVYSFVALTNIVL